MARHILNSYMQKVRLLPPLSFISIIIPSLTAYLSILFFPTLSGCATLKDPIVNSVTDEPALKTMPQYEDLKKEISRLEKLVAQKDELIKNQKIRQQNQTHIFREANKEATRTQIKLHRLATKPGTASAIAELETALEHHKQIRNASLDQILRIQARGLLEEAILFYSKDQYAVAMNYVSQANKFITLIANEDQKKASYVDYSLLEFHTPIKLRTLKNSFLRREPDQYAKVLGIIKKDTLLTANANQGPWLRVQANKSQGWVLNTMLEIEENRNP